MSSADRLVDTAQIVSEFGTSKPRISDWSNNPDSGFPAVAHTEGRKRFWRHDEVAAFFAQRAPKKRALPAAPSRSASKGTRPTFFPRSAVAPSPSTSSPIKPRRTTR
jgi:hypothetical protein